MTELRFASLAAATLALAGCHKAPAAADTAPVAAPRAAAVADAGPPVPAAPVDPASRAALVASAERFENLTEAAFSKVPGEAARRLDLAATSAAGIATMLPAGSGPLLAKALGDARAAAGAHDAAALSLASNEAYRIVLSAAGGEAKIPLAIGLLDYSGFRLTADARAAPPRWDDMAAALTYARGQWTGVKPQIANAKSVTDFDGVLTALEAAIGARDSAATLAAATRELDLVDVLETSVKPS